MRAVDSEPGRAEGGRVQGGGRDDDDTDGDDNVEDASRVHHVRRQAPASPSGSPPRTVDTSSSGAVGPSMFQTVLDRLDQLQMQN